MDTTGTMSRPLVVGALAVNVAAIATGLLWSDRLAGRYVVLLVGTGLIVASVGFSLASVVVPRGRTPGFVVRPGVAFVAPADRRFGYVVVGQVLLATVITWFPLFINVDPHGDSTLATMHAIVVVLAVLLAGLNFVNVGFALSGRPRLELTTDGVRLSFAYWWRAVRWDELAPGLPDRQPDRHSLTLTTLRPRRPAVRLRLHLVRVHEWFLADAIRYYVDRPEQRTEIGTPAGYVHLVTALGAEPVPS